MKSITDVTIKTQQGAGDGCTSPHSWACTTDFQRDCPLADTLIQHISEHFFHKAHHGRASVCRTEPCPTNYAALAAQWGPNL